MSLDLADEKVQHSSHATEFSSAVYVGAAVIG